MTNFLFVVYGLGGIALTAHQRTLLLFLLLGLGILGGSFYGFYEAERVAPLDEGVKPETEKAQIVVYVCGAVSKPGVVRLQEGARVVDAVKACGDLLPTADAAQVNMAQPLKDGAQITVPETPVALSPAGSGAPNAASTARAAATDKININTADVVALDKLPGIGPAMAARIIEYRKTEGAFQSPEDLKKVKGIGDAKFQKLKEQITL